MKIVFVVLFAVSYLTVEGQSYFQTFPKEVAAFNEFQNQHAEMYDSVFTKYQVDPLVAISIVAPEVGHYSVWRDQLEIRVVSLFYVEMGTEYNDFSIGNFQMKAAFAEKVEEYIKKLELKQFYSLLKFQSPESSEIREARVDRMQSVAYQSIYLAAFISICKKLYPSWFNSEREITLLANAYNFGFWNSEEQITKWQYARHFPSRGKAAFSYSLVAEEYYQSLLQR